MGSYAGYLLETFVTLLAVCGLAFVVLFGARRLGIGRPRGPIQLVGQLPLDARRAIYLVQVGNQVLVVGASEAGITKLGEVGANDLPAIDPTTQAPFADVLARVLGTAKKTPTTTRPTAAPATTAATAATTTATTPTTPEDVE
jgi:flagellar biogenesis protein FliO